MKNLTIVLLVLLSLAACKNNNSEEAAGEPSQMEKVIAVHDELMPKMGEIGGYITKLEASIDSTAVDSLKIRAIADLKAANQSMMSWMKDFGQAFTGDEIRNGAGLSDEKQKILNEFEKSVDDLKKEMMGAIDRAGDLLNR